MIGVKKVLVAIIHKFLIVLIFQNYENLKFSACTIYTNVYFKNRNCYKI